LCAWVSGDEGEHGAILTFRKESRNTRPMDLSDVQTSAAATKDCRRAQGARLIARWGLIVPARCWSAVNLVSWSST